MGIYNILLITILVSGLAVLIVWMDGRQADNKTGKKKKGKASKSGKKRKLQQVQSYGSMR